MLIGDVDKFVEKLHTIEVEETPPLKNYGYRDDDTFTDEELKVRNSLLYLFKVYRRLAKLEEFNSFQKKLYLAIEDIYAMKFYVTKEQYLEVMSFLAYGMVRKFVPKQIPLINGWKNLAEIYHTCKDEEESINDSILFENIKNVLTIRLKMKSYEKVINELY